MMCNELMETQIAALCIVPCVAVPISILSAILFHFVFEGPFMIGASKAPEVTGPGISAPARTC